MSRTIDRTSHRLGAVLAVALASAPGAAWGQTRNPNMTASDTARPDPVAEARQHFTRGVKLYEEDDFRTALIEFNRAYELAPNWQVLYNIGQASYQLRDYAAALQTLEKYSAAGGVNIPPDRRQQVDREMDELRGRVAHVTFAANVEGAEIVVDDVSLGSTPFRGPQLVGAGRHKITANKLGWNPTTRVVDIAGGDNLTIRLELREEHRDGGSELPDLTRPRPSYTAAVVIGALGVVGIAAGSVFGALALNDRSTLNGECNTSRQCPYGTQNEIDSFTRNGTVSTIAFAAGGAAIVFAGILYFTERGKAGKDAPRSAGLHLVPWVGPAGVGVSGTF